MCLTKHSLACLGPQCGSGTQYAAHLSSPEAIKTRRPCHGSCQKAPKADFRGRGCTWKPPTERAGLAGWAGWAGWLAGLAGWAAWAGLLGWLRWAGLGRDSAWDWFCRLLARISSNRASWVWFSRFLEPTPESVQIELPGIRFIGFWSQGLKVIKSSFLGLVFLTSGANARKSSNQASWDSFCRLLEPRPESHQIESPGTGFLDYWSQRQKSQAKAFQTPKRTSLC